MNNQKNIITNLSLVLMLLFPLLSFAMPESGETITRRGVINDDYYAAGGTVDINAIISGDAVVAGGDLFIGHHVKGDVMLAGGSVHIRGDIEDDVRTAGGDIPLMPILVMTLSQVAAGLMFQQVQALAAMPGWLAVMCLSAER